MILRSALYVPGTRPELFEKALASAADAVILDLEDAVAPDRKVEARAIVAELLGAGAGAGTGAAAAGAPPKPVYVRVNGLHTAFGRADVEALRGLPLTGIRLPKVESAEQVQTVAGWLEGTRLQLWCLIESALGLERAYEIATAHPAVTSIGLGEADLRASLRVSDPAGLLYARSRCVAAARAAGLESPMQAVYTNVHDLKGLRASCARAKDLGFYGRNCIHPAQLETVNEVFTPSEEDVMTAKQVVDALAGAIEDGAGAVVLADGRFVDLAIVEQARRILAVAELVGTA